MNFVVSFLMTGFLNGHDFTLLAVFCDADLSKNTMIISLGFIESRFLAFFRYRQVFCNQPDIVLHVSS